MNTLLEKITDSKTILKSLMGLVLMVVCSQIVIPIQPVPITLQTVAVLLIGLTFSTREAFYAMISYLVIGMAGAPFFANWTFGLNVISGPKGGYYIGFVIAATSLAFLRSKIKNETPLSIFFLVLIGQSLIYFFGLAWLSQFIGIQKAIEIGFLPFIFSGAIKSVILTVLLDRLKRVNK